MTDRSIEQKRRSLQPRDAQRRVSTSAIDSAHFSRTGQSGYTDQESMSLEETRFEKNPACPAFGGKEQQ